MRRKEKGPFQIKCKNRSYCFVFFPDTLKEEKKKREKKIRHCFTKGETLIIKFVITKIEFSRNDVEEDAFKKEEMRMKIGK